MKLEIGEYYFWSEGFGSSYQHQVVYLVRLCEVLGDEENEVVFKVIHQGFSNEYWLMKDSEERKVGELCKEFIPSKRIEHLNYFKPVDLHDRKELKNEKYEEIIRIIRYDRLRFLRRQLNEIIEENQAEISATEKKWIYISAIVERLNELKFPIAISDLHFLAEFNNRFEFSENKDKLRLKS